MAAPYHFVERDDETRKTYDAGVKNKFKWEWLTEKDIHGDFLSSYIRKLDADGLAWCCFCRNVVNYSNRRIDLAARPVLDLMLVNRKSINENVGKIRLTTSYRQQFKQHRVKFLGVSNCKCHYYGSAPNI